jgi:hypothetical protein
MAEQWLIDAKRKLEKMPEDAKALRQLAIDDLYVFAQLMNPGYVYGDIHKECFKWMQDYSLFGLDDQLTANKLIMLPRAHLKSHMVATWAAWIIVRHPEVTILYVSATSGLAETQLYAIKNILASTVFTRYFPEYIDPQEGKREKWSNTTISIDHEKRKLEGIRDATIDTAGLTTNTTGWHADIVIADDLVVPENAYTEDGRESVSKKSSQFTSIRNAGGFTLACGTRYHPNDVYATWKAQEYDVYDKEGLIVERRKVWEIKEHVVETDGIFIWPRTIRPKDGKAFGFDQQVLSRIRAEYSDRTQFYSQYYNDPNDPGSNRISADKFQYYERKFLKQSDGNWYFKGNRLNVFASIDFAFSIGKRSDDTAIVVIGVDADNFIYLLDISVFQTDKISKYFDEIARLHSKWEFRKLRAEVTVAQTVIVRDLKDKLREQGLSLSIDEYRPNRSEGTKEERIASALEHRYENGHIWHFKGGYTDVLEEQLIQARPAHDDIKDALASAVMIAVKPKSRGGLNKSRDNIIPIHSRFGGISFR